MVANQPCGVDLKPIVRALLADVVAEDALSRWAPTDIAEADKEDADRATVCVLELRGMTHSLFDC